MKRPEAPALLAIGSAALVASGVNPYDRRTWFLEVWQQSNEKGQGRTRPCPLVNTNSGYLLPAVYINLRVKLKFATTGFTRRIILFIFLAKPNFCAETSRAFQIG